MYASLSGNTEKVALRFKSTFEKHGWQCDAFKLDRETDIHHLPFRFKDYDFVCVGSGVILHEPYNEILMPLRRAIFGVDPRLFLQSRGEAITYMKYPIPDPATPEPAETSDGNEPMQHHKVVWGADSKKSVVFITYSGYDFGPKEAQPALALLALEIEHLGFECIGWYSCPGRFGDGATPQAYHGDIRNRPDEKDLLRAELFIEEKLEQIADRTV
jgi:hypothetical protein